MNELYKVRPSLEEIIQQRSTISEKHRSYIMQFLKEGDHLTLAFSNRKKKYYVAYISSGLSYIGSLDYFEIKRILFFKEYKSKLVYQYDSEELIKKFESNSLYSNKSNSDNNKDSIVFLHLAISYRYRTWRNNMESKYDNELCVNSILYFIAFHSDTVGKPFLKVLFDSVFFFIHPHHCFELFYQSYAFCDLPLEAAITYFKFADSCFFEDVRKHEYYGLAHLTLDNYKNAKKEFEKILKSEEKSLFCDMNYIAYLFFLSLGMEQWKSSKMDSAMNSIQTAKKLVKVNSYEESLMSCLHEIIGSDQKLIKIADLKPLVREYRRRKTANEPIGEPQIIISDNQDLLKFFIDVWSEEVNDKDSQIDQSIKDLSIYEECFNKMSEEVNQVHKKLSQVRTGWYSQQSSEKFKSQNKRTKNYEYKAWHEDTSPNGLLIDEKKKDDIVTNGSENYDLIVIKEETFTQVFIEGRKAVSIGGLSFDILIYVLKHKGTGGNSWNIAKHIYNSSEVKEAEREEDEEFKSDKRARISSKVRQSIKRLNDYLISNKLDVTLTSKHKNPYKLTRQIRYCLIERISNL